MATETFSWPVRAGSTGQVGYRVLTAQFGGGLSQVAVDGPNNIGQSWNVQVIGLWGPSSCTRTNDVQAAKAFLDDHAGARSFYWTPPGGVQGLYRASSLSLERQGRVWILTSTFTEVFLP